MARMAFSVVWYLGAKMLRLSPLSSWWMTNTGFEPKAISRLCPHAPLVVVVVGVRVGVLLGVKVNVFVAVNVAVVCVRLTVGVLLGKAVGIIKAGLVQLARAVSIVFGVCVCRGT